MDILLSICVGIGLSAACGFRVFLPLFALSLGAKFGNVPLDDHFQWLASTPACIALGVATVSEIAAYFIPFVDHLLDTLASPLAICAGVIATAAVLTDTAPWLQWSLAVIAGGGIAAMAQTSTVLLRTASTLTTAGLGNPIFAFGEFAFSTFLSILALVFPLITALVAVSLIALILLKIRKRPQRNAPSASGPA